MTSAAIVTVILKLRCEPASVASQGCTAMLHFYSTPNVVKIEILHGTGRGMKDCKLKDHSMDCKILILPIDAKLYIVNIHLIK